VQDPKSFYNHIRFTHSSKALRSRGAAMSLRGSGLENDFFCRELAAGTGPGICLLFGTIDPESET
jgi:hypothetical protein